MSIKALIKLSTRDKKGNLKAYEPDEILDLTKDEEQRLVDRGFAEYTKEVKATQTDSKDTKSNDGNSDEGGESSGPDTGYPGA